VAASPFRDAGALVTGASSGIGVAIAKELAKSGARLALTARRAGLLEAVADECRELGSPAVAVIVDDLADPGAAARIAERATAVLNGVDVLVNNAGFAVPGLSERADPARVAAMIQVNCASPVALTRLLLPSMVERGRGWILNVSSMAGIVPAPFQAGYAGTKAFNLNWSESLREEVASRGVVVSALCPGVTDTEFFEAAGYRHLGKFMKYRMPAEPVAKAGIRALLRKKPRVVPGALNKALMFVGVRLAPRRLLQYVAGKLMGSRPPPVR
jgi:uncharacterized protein